MYAVSNNSWMRDVIRIGHLTTTEEVETMSGVVKVFGNVQCSTHIDSQAHL